MTLEPELDVTWSVANMAPDSNASRPGSVRSPRADRGDWHVQVSSEFLDREEPPLVLQVRLSGLRVHIENVPLRFYLC